MAESTPFVTIASRHPADRRSLSSGDSTVRGDTRRVKSHNQPALITRSQYGSSAGDERVSSATHDISRVNYHVKDIHDFAASLEGSASRAFPNRGSSQRYSKVHAILLHWKSDDLFVLPELEDLETCFRDDYSFETEIFSIPSDNAHLELMLRIGAMIKEHESTDTLFVVYYGGHAKIDDSRQSTWCATRNSDSPWLQWSAIQTLLERSLSDVLILLDCCAGAASATFPSGNSITETISASSWDAIAPDPGRYSFTNVLIEVLHEWRRRVFSAAMLHAEVLARLKHPRPIMVNGRNYEARSTPVHFMMTNNHRAPSIELARLISSDKRPPSPPQESTSDDNAGVGRSAGPQEIVGSSPNEDVPHVMISLALEEDQRLNISDWQQWLSTIPALAKYVKVQGVFKSHSTLLLLSMPVMVWDLLPESHACNFVAFIRSNNLAIPDEPDDEGYEGVTQGLGEERLMEEGSRFSFLSGTTAFTFTDGAALGGSRRGAGRVSMDRGSRTGERPSTSRRTRPTINPSSTFTSSGEPRGWPGPSLAPGGKQKGVAPPPTVLNRSTSSDNIAMSPIINRYRSGRRTVFPSIDAIPNRPALAPHVESRLEQYFLYNPYPTVAVKEFLASNLGIETTDIDLWFHHRREHQEVSERLQSLTIDDHSHDAPREGVRMLLPGNLNKLLEAVPSSDILVVDLRSSSDYERSHIHGAINLRAPASFVSRATFELIEKALDESSRSAFSKWSSSKCVVFYDRHIEFAWEAPVAEAMFQKLRNQGWPGQCFALKGHYREFSASFDKYIVGTRVPDNVKDHLAGLDPSHNLKDSGHQQYNDWLQLLEEENRIHYTDLVPLAKAERMEAMVIHQKEMETEFQKQHLGLYRKAQDLNPDTNWGMKAAMVEHLDRGLALMRKTDRSYTDDMGTDPMDLKLRNQSYTRGKFDSFQGTDGRDFGEPDAERRASDSLYKPGLGRSPAPADDVEADRKAPSRLGGGRGFMTRLLNNMRPDASG